jgi:hypothetical protein
MREIESFHALRENSPISRRGDQRGLFDRGFGDPGLGYGVLRGRFLERATNRFRMLSSGSPVSFAIMLAALRLGIPK